MKLLLASLVCIVAYAQNAQISGLVEDPSGSIVPLAEINVRNEQTGGRRVTRSNESGLYGVPSLSPGAYRVTVRMAGFETIIREGVKLYIGDSVRLDFALRIGDSRTVVTVKGGPPSINAENASVGTIIDRNFIAEMPLNGRGIQTLVELTPGATVVPVTSISAGQFAVNGQRSDANYFTVDGVSANFAAGVASQTGMPVTFNSLGQTGGGSIPANNLLGTFSNLVSPDALQEFQIQTSTFAPEFGRSPGAQVGLVTRSGTNRFSGSLFEYLRNDATDANDWFSDKSGLSKPPLRFNNFGGTLGGPVQLPGLYNGHDHTFFFLSFEDLLMRQPQPPVEVLVPTVQARLTAPALAAALLDASPLPNRPASDLGATDPGLAAFIGSSVFNHDQQTYGLRLDHYFNDRVTLFARYNQAPSRVLERPPLAFDTDTEHYTLDTQMLTVGITQIVRSNLVNEVRLNLSRQDQNVSASLDNFGGAKKPADSLLFPSGFSVTDSAVVLFGIPGFVEIGLLLKDRARQFQAVDNLSWTSGKHLLKFGADHRWFSPIAGLPRVTSEYEFDNLTSGVASSAYIQEQNGRTAFNILAFSAYAQDTWRVSQKIALTCGLRWDLNPAPSVSDGQIGWAQQLTNLHDFSNVAPLGPGHSPYSNHYLHFAPRFGGAWQLFDGQSYKTVIRTGGGLFYDLAQVGFADSFSIPFDYASYSNVPFGSLQLGSLQHATPEYVAAAPGYTLPRIYQWNVTVEQSIGKQTFSAAYVGSLGRGLIGTATINLVNIPFPYEDRLRAAINIFGNAFSSSYNSLQLQFNRRLASRVQTLLSYTWSHSIDNVSNDSGDTAEGGTSFLTSPEAFLNPNLDRGSSDFDIRHSLNGAVLIGLPSPHRGFATTPLKNWTLSSIFFARSAPPSDPVSVFSPGLVPLRPDVVPGEPFYLYGSGYPGGKRFNPAAFVAPPDGVGQGDLGRNVLRGFGAWQIDLALHREFQLSDRFSLQFRAESFNILNHPNFANPAAQPDGGGVGFPTFGLSTATLASSLGPTGTQGQLNPLFQIGGPRSLQFALRLKF